MTDQTAEPVDDHERFKAEQMANPESRAAYEDAGSRHQVIWALIQRRKKSGLSVKQVAERMGVTLRDVAAYENGATDPRLSFHQRYARAVGVKVRVEVDTGPPDT